MPSLISVKLPGFADRDAHWERVIRRTESTDHPSAANVIPLNVWKWRLSYCWSQRAASAYTSSDTIWKMHPGRLSRWDKIHFDPSPLWHSEGKFDWFIRPASPQPPFNETVIAHGRPALHRRREKKCGQNVKYNQFSTHTDEEWEENETCGQKEDGETEHMCRCQKNNITKKTNTNMTEGMRKKKQELGFTFTQTKDPCQEEVVKLWNKGWGHPRWTGRGQQFKYQFSELVTAPDVRTWLLSSAHDH